MLFRSATASDPDLGDIITWGLSDGPDGATIDPNSGQFTWTPTQADAVIGSTHIVIRAYDLLGAYGEQTIELPVHGVDTPPLIVSTAPTQGVIGNHFIYVVRAIDTDGDNVSFTITVTDTATSMSIDSGAYSFVPLDSKSAKFDWLPPARRHLRHYHYCQRWPRWNVCATVHARCQHIRGGHTPDIPQYTGAVGGWRASIPLYRRGF